MRSPSQSYGASPAIWDHTVLPANRHRCMRPAITWMTICRYATLLSVPTIQANQLGHPSIGRPKWVSTPVLYPWGKSVFFMLSVNCFISVSVCMSGCVVILTVCLLAVAFPHISVYFCTSVCLYGCVCLSVSFFVCLYVCLSVFSVCVCMSVCGWLWWPLACWLSCLYGWLSLSFSVSIFLSVASACVMMQF